MAGEPSLNPPECPEMPEPTDDEWLAWRLKHRSDELWEWLGDVKHEDIMEAIDAHIVEPRLKGKRVDCAKIGQALIDLVNEWVEMGDASDFYDDNPPSEPDCDGPDEPDYEPCNRFYDGTGSPY